MQLTDLSSYQFKPMLCKSKFDNTFVAVNDSECHILPSYTCLELTRKSQSEDAMLSRWLTDVNIVVYLCAMEGRCYLSSIQPTP